MAPNYSVYQFERDLQIPGCQIQMKAISLQRFECVRHKTTRLSAVSSDSINNSRDGTCHKEAAIKVTELTGSLYSVIKSVSQCSSAKQCAR